MSKNPLISVIVCSTNSNLRNRLYENIDNNIGCDFEFLFKDNTINSEGICKVYNDLASDAKGEYLCFVHEDVLIDTFEWGGILVNKAQDRMTGVIGFAGAEKISYAPYWHFKDHLHYNFIQLNRTGDLIVDFSISKSEERFSEVTVLDGMFLFCRKEVWLKGSFDEVTFNGFHFYDIDFTLNTSNHFVNYVCNSFSIKHFSLGSVNASYYSELITFCKKWKKKLALNESEVNMHLIRSLAFEMISKANLSFGRSLFTLKEIGVCKGLRNYMLSIYFCLRFSIKLFITKKMYN